MIGKLNQIENLWFSRWLHRLKLDDWEVDDHQIGFEFLLLFQPQLRGIFLLSHGNRQSSDSTEEWNQAPETRNHGDLMVALPKKQTRYQHGAFHSDFFFHGDDRLLNYDTSTSLMGEQWTQSWRATQCHTKTPKDLYFNWDPLLLN